MKSKFFFAFAVVSVFAAVLVSSCSKDSTTTTTNNGCINVNGNVDTGIHRIFGANGTLDLSGLVPDIRDTLSATVTGNDIEIFDNALNQNLTGTLNCNDIVLDSVLFGPNDTLVINSATLGRVTIWGVRAGGQGSIATDGTVSTTIKIKKGTTNLAILPDLGGIWLKGTFKKSN
jgi:hypothetical protein